MCISRSAVRQAEGGGSTLSVSLTVRYMFSCLMISPYIKHCVTQKLANPESHYCSFQFWDMREAVRSRLNPDGRHVSWSVNTNRPHMVKKNLIRNRVQTDIHMDGTDLTERTFVWNPFIPEDSNYNSYCQNQWRRKATKLEGRLWTIPLREAPHKDNACSNGILPNSVSTPPPPQANGRFVAGIFRRKLANSLKQRFWLWEWTFWQ